MSDRLLHNSLLADGRVDDALHPGKSLRKPLSRDHVTPLEGEIGTTS
jgi:hypothetical protein